MPPWRVDNGSGDPITVMAALAKLSWNAGRLDAVNMRLTEAVLAVADDPSQPIFLRRAAVRAAALLAPEYSSNYLADIL
jgi:hypothetical protein